MNTIIDLTVRFVALAIFAVSTFIILLIAK